MKFLWFLCVSLLALRMAAVEAQTTCGPRLRKDWDMMNSTEKATYKGALAAAMDSGAYIKFIEMHTEMRSEMEAHRQCMFIYWHRLLLVVFENMLRGQGTQFACVTVPYFNWIAASSRVTAGTCTSFGSCMAITRELGGFTNGSQRTLAINGINNSGRCVTEAPLDHFCQLSSTTGAACAKCVPRSDWSTVRIPSAAGYASVRQQVFNGKNIGEMSPLVENGCHNNVHANLGSTMGTFASPSDPIFWSHHAMVDLLHVIFHKCRVGSTRLTFAQKAANEVAWTSCARRSNGGVFNPTDVITMRTGEKGVNPIDGRTDPLIGKYFTGVPSQFAGLMDVRDLGSSSYGYYISGQVATMYSQCDAAPTTRRMERVMEAAGVKPPTMCSSVDTKGDYISPDGVHVDGYDLPGNVNGYEHISQDDGHVDVVVKESTKEQQDASEQRVANWYDQTIEAMGGDSHENMADLERQACMFENQCLGGTDDYSPEFKAIWNATEPRCKTIVDAINNGSQSIVYESWREVMETHFGCPQPSNISYSANSTSSSYLVHTADSVSTNSWGSDVTQEETTQEDIAESTW
ncbi:hypothetical protein PHYBOEH_005904 [Phytophthora boehmeriae]|uniref:Tyrosinase copper-binding domain-containing protein n=1 Tax=Phytophthora boehmeriae TaxID=109152 RepID=A0A8T1WKV8_9STRA|nr:hypothetical protein PHYBOEH_005904 [Phytophthora boehmeriae]